jgi:hypothetical protein
MIVAQGIGQVVIYFDYILLLPLWLRPDILSLDWVSEEHFVNAQEVLTSFVFLSPQ